MTGKVRPEDVEALIERFQASGCTELLVRFPGFELHLSSGADGAQPEAAPRTAPAPARQPASSAPASAPVATPPAAMDLDGFEIVRAPYQGMFYRAPKPGDPPFVEIGSEVEAQTDLCLIEVMKLFTAVRAGIGGRIARVLAADGTMVEGGQPLFAITPRA
jgi:acetyl-CoA carboxylase biotin carboxyl carrier protein